MSIEAMDEDPVLAWQRALGLAEGRLSVVDMAICPIPLGWSILSEGRLLLDRHPQQRMTLESRINERLAPSA